MSMTTYALSAATKKALQRANLWDRIPANQQAQWSQRFYNNKAAVRAAEGTDEDAFAFIQRFVRKVATGEPTTSGRGESAEAFLDRMTEQVNAAAAAIVQARVDEMESDDEDDDTGIDVES